MASCCCEGGRRVSEQGPWKIPITDLVRHPFWKDNRDTQFESSDTNFLKVFGIGSVGRGDSIVENALSLGSRG